MQIEFNPLLVESYRLIGYENRVLENQDFEDDKKDAGEISVGQNITALYEIKPAADAGAFRTNPAFTIQFRYKLPEADTSTPLSLKVFDTGLSFERATESMRFTASVAGFAMLLHASKYKGSVSFENILQWANGARTFDPFNRRAGFIGTVKKAAQLK